MFRIGHLNRLLVLIGIAASVFASQLAGAAEPMALTSPAFKDGAMMATKYAGNIKGNANCVGENISPAFAWSHIPAGTKSLAFVMTDPDGRAGLGVDHWVAYGIQPSVSGFAEGEVSQVMNKYVAGKGSRGLGHYLGPCPPAGSGMHHYTFTLIATDLEPAALPAGLTREELFQKLDGHAKGGISLIGLFGRP